MPQPIDPTTELSRLSAAERVQTIMERNAQLAQQRMADAAGLDTRQQQEQVLQTDQKHAEVENELKRRNPFMGRRKRKDQPEDDEQFETYNAHQKRELPEGGHGLDVTL